MIYVLKLALLCLILVIELSLSDFIVTNDLESSELHLTLPGLQVQYFDPSKSDTRETSTTALFRGQRDLSNDPSNRLVMSVFTNDQCNGQVIAQQQVNIGMCALRFRELPLFTSDDDSTNNAITTSVAQNLTYLNSEVISTVGNVFTVQYNNYTDPLCDNAQNIISTRITYNSDTCYTDNIYGGYKFVLKGQSESVENAMTYGTSDGYLISRTYTTSTTCAANQPNFLVSFRLNQCFVIRNRNSLPNASRKFTGCFDIGGKKVAKTVTYTASQSCEGTFTDTNTYYNSSCVANAKMIECIPNVSSGSSHFIDQEYAGLAICLVLSGFIALAASYWYYCMRPARKQAIQEKEDYERKNAEAKEDTINPMMKK